MIGFAGHLRLRAVAKPDGRTNLSQQSFRAPFHLSKPYWDAEARTLLVQVVNPTAGILAGDRLESQIEVDSGAALLVTTPSASRVFTMTDGCAECLQQFSVGAGGWLEVSPEALVPHRGSRYRQFTRLEIDAGGTAFFIEQLLPGRIGHGEAWLWSELCLDLEARYDGKLILRERFASTGDELRALAEFSGSGPQACFANAVLIGPLSASGWRRAVEALHGGGLWVGVSALRHTGWTIKIVAPDSLRLRDTLASVRRILAQEFPALKCSARKL